MLCISLESPHWDDSNEYTQNTIFNMNKKNTLNYPKSAAMGFFPRDFKNEFETAMVNEPSVFEPLKFYCILDTTYQKPACPLSFHWLFTQKAPKQAKDKISNTWVIQGKLYSGFQVLRAKSELLIRGDTEDNSKIFFISEQIHMLWPLIRTVWTRWF